MENSIIKNTLGYICKIWNSGNIHSDSCNNNSWTTMFLLRNFVLCHNCEETNERLFLDIIFLNILKDEYLYTFLEKILVCIVKHIMDQISLFIITYRVLQFCESLDCFPHGCCEQFVLYFPSPNQGLTQHCYDSFLSKKLVIKFHLDKELRI